MGLEGNAVNIGTHIHTHSHTVTHISGNDTWIRGHFQIRINIPRFYVKMWTNHLSLGSTQLHTPAHTYTVALILKKNGTFKHSTHFSFHVNISRWLLSQRREIVSLSEKRNCFSLREEKWYVNILKFQNLRTISQINKKSYSHEITLPLTVYKIHNEERPATWPRAGLSVVPFVEAARCTLFIRTLDFRIFKNLGQL